MDFRRVDVGANVYPARVLSAPREPNTRIQGLGMQGEAGKGQPHLA